MISYTEIRNETATVQFNYKAANKYFVGGNALHLYCTCTAEATVERRGDSRRNRPAQQHKNKVKRTIRSTHIRYYLVFGLSAIVATRGDRGPSRHRATPAGGGAGPPPPAPLTLNYHAN